MRTPSTASPTEISGLSTLKNVKGAYATVDTPSVAAMNAPQLFHGISAEVTVAESPNARALYEAPLR